MTDKLKRIVRILLIAGGISLAALVILAVTIDFPAIFTGEYFTGKEYTHEINISNSFEVENIQRIEVNLSSDDIRINPIEGEKITLLYSGTVRSSKEINEPYLLMDERNGILSINKPDTVNIGLGFHYSNLSLRIGVPENRLEELDLSTSSGNISVSGNLAARLFVDTSSGLGEVASYQGESLNISSSSGNQNLTDIETEKNIRIDSSSGDIRVTEVKAEQLILDTTSGSAEIFGMRGSLVHSSSSGDLFAEIPGPGNIIESKVSSGRMEIALPENADFTLTFDTSSGDFNCDFPLTVNGNLDNDNIRGTVGSGERLLEFDSSSGDLTIKKL